MAAGIQDHTVPKPPRFMAITPPLKLFQLPRNRAHIKSRPVLQAISLVYMHSNATRAHLIVCKVTLEQTYCSATAQTEVMNHL